MAYLLQLDGFDGNDYTFPATFYPADRSFSNVVPQAKLARTAGARQLTGYLNGARLVIRGGMLGPTAPIGGQSNWRDAMDDLRAALLNLPGELWFGEDDRYYRCVQCENGAEPYDATFWNRIMAGGDIALTTGDPYRYAKDPTTESTWTSVTTGGTHDYTPAGEQPSKPTISITVGGAGTQTIAYTLANGQTGESFTLAGQVTGGNVIVLDSLLKTVKIGTTDKRLLFEGQFLSLNPGTNTLTVTIDSGSITSIALSWRDRWL